MSSLVIVFDLDGTLTDPRQGIVDCLRYALERRELECPADHVLASFIGPPLRVAFSALLGTSDETVIEDAVATYRERYTRTGIFQTRLYDGIPAMLDGVTGATAARFVATSKPAVFASRIVEHLGLDRHFAGVYGTELDGRFDDKSDLLEHLLATEGIDARDAVMVGDRAFDVVAAKRNGMRSIGVLWGYGSEGELREAGADELCAKPVDVASRLIR